MEYSRWGDLRREDRAEYARFRELEVFTQFASDLDAATQQALPAQLLSLLRGLFLVVPAALLLSALWGVCGLWLALPAAELATALACAVLFLRLKKS